MDESTLQENPNSPGSRLTKLITGALLEMYSPTSSTVEIELPVMRDGQVVREKVPFAILSDAVEYNRLIEDSKVWVGETIELGNKGLLPPGMKELFAPDGKMLAEVFVLSRLAVDQEWKDKVAWLTLARKANPVFRTIYRLVTTAAVRTDFDIENKVIEDEKKDS